MNSNYRTAAQADLIIGQSVFCYYVTATPEPSSLGTIVTEPDREGWVDVRTEDGRLHNFDAQRLAIDTAS